MKTRSFRSRHNIQLTSSTMVSNPAFVPHIRGMSAMKKLVSEDHVCLAPKRVIHIRDNSPPSRTISGVKPVMQRLKNHNEKAI
jgi:hypothetical protein